MARESFRVDAEIEALLPPQSAEESALLEAAILDGGHVDAGVVLDIAGDKVLGDGHHRRAVCRRHKLKFPTRVVKVPNRDAAIRWVIDNQLARRNLTDERRAYYIGLEYLQAKQGHGGDRRGQVSSGQFDHLKSTSEEIAEKHGTSEATVRRDAKFTEAVDSLPPDQKEAVLSGDSGATRAQVVSAPEALFCRDCRTRGIKPNCAKCREFREIKNPSAAKAVGGHEPGPPPSYPGVPERLLPYFTCIPDLQKAARKATALGNLLSTIEQTSLAYRKRFPLGKPRTSYASYAHSAALEMKLIMPGKPCPECGGAEEPSADADRCPTCEDIGFLTVGDMEDAKHAPRS